MATLTKRALEAQIATALEARAERSGRSLEAEIGAILLGRAAGNPAPALRGLAERIAVLTPDAAQTDSTAPRPAGSTK
jgi:plasmid stability protein